MEGELRITGRCRNAYHILRTSGMSVRRITTRRVFNRPRVHSDRLRGRGGKDAIERVDDICREWRRQKPFVDRQAIQIELEEKTALERNMFDPKRNHKQKSNDMPGFSQHDARPHVREGETTITQENGAFIVSRFRKDVCKTIGDVRE